MGNRVAGSLPKDLANHESPSHTLSIGTWATPIAIFSIKLPSDKSPASTRG